MDRCLHRYLRRGGVSPAATGHRRVAGDRSGGTGYDAVPGRRRGYVAGDRGLMPVRLAVLDMAGTTVADAGAVEEAFQGALDAMGLTAADLAEDPTVYVRRTMGRSK